VCVCGVGCQCESLEDNRVVRQQRWRELCAKFYYDQDETAKRVLDFFEGCKVDEIRCVASCSLRTVKGLHRIVLAMRFYGCAVAGSISTVEETGADEQFNELVHLLGLQKCMVPGHEEKLTEK
jgi:hypothetical protein